MYRDLALAFLRTVHVDVTSDPRCEEGYISFYLNREFYEYNLSVFNSIFDFSASMNMPYYHVPKNFNPNTFWYEICGDYQYDTSTPKGIVIRNLCTRVGQRLLACGLFVRENSLNVSCLSELYFLYTMLPSNRLNQGSFLVS